MSSRETILNSIKKNRPSSTIELPNTDISHVKYRDRDKKFATTLKSVGGDAFWLEDKSVDEFVAENYRDLDVIVSTYLEFNGSTKDANELETPHLLEDVDLAVIKGEFAVAENGAVWVKNPKNHHRALYFLATRLLIVVDKNSIVDSMHEAYKLIDFSRAGYGTFISGPSKTADIEQALVIGAHGAIEVCVLFV